MKESETANNKHSVTSSRNIYHEIRDDHKTQSHTGRLPLSVFFLLFYIETVKTTVMTNIKLAFLF